MSRFMVDYPEVSTYPAYDAAPQSFEDGQYSGDQAVYYQCEYPTEQYQEETTPRDTEESLPQTQTSRDEQDVYRDRERDRDRSYRRPRESRSDKDRRDYDRDRSKDRDYDRQRSRERDNDRSRGRSRDSERRRDSGRDRSSHDDINEDSGFGVDDGSRSDSGDEYERSSQRRRGYSSESHLGGDRWIREEPSNTIVLRGLNSLITEKDIYGALEDVLDTVKEVRLMRRSKGSSRGFAFAEFKSVEEAQRWKEQKQGVVMLKNEYPVYMNFSITRSNSDLSSYNRTDWICSKCGAHNFKRRNCCYKCYLSREESDMARDGDGHDQIGLNPCNTLIFRGLDALTTEETLLKAISVATPLTVKNIKVIRDDLTKSSRGFGFSELNSVTDSTQILDSLTNMSPAFEVDGKVIMVNYAKNTFSTVMLTLPVSSGAAAQGFEYDEFYQNYLSSSQTGFVDASGQYFYSPSYNQQYIAQQEALQATSTPGETPDTQANATNAAAAVAQAAIQQANAVKKYRKQAKKDPAMKEEEAEYTQPAEEWAQGAPLSIGDSTDHEFPQYPNPDVSSFQYEPSSGYYYDATTGLYYDANSQYFYNSTSGQFLYWCAEKMTYLPAPTSPDDESLKADKGDGKEKDKKEKVKVAKKIAKDMEKWAKTLNAIKDGSSKKSAQMSGAMLKESATADAGFTILEKAGKRPSEDIKLMPPPPPLWDATGNTAPIPAPSTKAKPGLVAYGEDSDSDDDDQSAVSTATVTDETQLIDWNKLTCLLCKRQFQNKETLTKHQQMSDLHKQNLEALKASKVAANDGSKNEYRDRAKERRQKYGTSAPPTKRRHKPHPEPEIIYEQPTKEGITNDNIGNKLLQKMGWAAGQGLGKEGQGIIKPIEATRRVLSAGLGAKGGNIVAGASDSYKEAVKKTMYARYKEMD